jgi:hypothetical protein
VSWSNPHQGLESNIDRYRNSPVMHKDVPDAYKPCVFDCEGMRISLPAPTKRVRCPRLRAPASPNGSNRPGCGQQSRGDHKSHAGWQQAKSESAQREKHELGKSV